MHTERSSVVWIVRFVRFHGRRARENLFPAEPKIDAFLTDLAVHGHVAAAPQHQAMAGRIKAVRADKKITVPVVMTHDEVAAVLSLLDGPAHLGATRLDGSGLRIMEAVRLRGKDMADQMKPLTVRSGKGDQDRCTTFPASLTPLLQIHLAGVKTRHQPDSAQGHGEVYLPHGLARKSPHAANEWRLAVCLSRPGHLRSPSFRCHPSPSR
jgi:integrase